MCLFAGAGYDVEREGETYKSTAMVEHVFICPDISLDGQQHSHFGHLRPHIPEAPFDLALHCPVQEHQHTTLCGTTLHRTGPR